MPRATAEAEVDRRTRDEAAAAAALAEAGHLHRLWRLPSEDGTSKAVGLYSAESEAELGGHLAGLPLFPWMRVTTTPLQPHPNDPARVAVTSSGRGGPR